MEKIQGSAKLSFCIFMLLPRQEYCLTWINFRDFRVFWPLSRNKVHAKFLGIRMKYRENRNKFHDLVDFQFNSLIISFRVKLISKLPLHFLKSIIN